MPARSYLFVPGNRPERFEKALQSGADAVIVDLEDAVPPQLKVATRAVVAEWLSADHPVYVRVNAQDTEWYADDFRAINRPGLRGLILPKAEDEVRIAQLASALAGSASLLPIIESGQGLWNSHQIARCPKVERLAFGHLDFQHDMRIPGDGEELLYARSHVVLVSRVAGIEQPIDGITAALDDAQRLQQDVDRARRMGFGGKLCIHPRQVQAVNHGFLPSEKEIAWAKSVLEAADAAAGAAVRLGGEMVDAPVIARAKQILASH